MNHKYSFKIDSNIINIFSNNINYIKNKYNIKEYYELTQIHSTITNIVDNNYINKTEGDALITNKVNTPLVIKTALVGIWVDKPNSFSAIAPEGITFA